MEKRKFDEKQIAFITCVNDETEYAECQYYLNRLRIPDGYSADILAIREAPSMAAGYNAAMEASPARYKVYLHQDVFIKNPNFIAGLLALFRSDSQIGMLGMVGRTHPETEADRIMRWNAGKIEDNIRPLDFSLPAENDLYTEVTAADGLLLATQYDIPWREDLFGGWDFYDISQCMEFRKKGFSILVPRQEEAWCYHDCSYPNFRHYYDSYLIFAREYLEKNTPLSLTEDPAFSEYKTKKELAQNAEQLRKSIETVFQAGGRAQLRTLFQEPALSNVLLLREYECIVRIDLKEETGGSGRRFWTDGLSVAQLLLKLRTLKYALKRIEYGAAQDEKDFLADHYSAHAVREVCERYCFRRERIYHYLGEIAEPPFLSQ